MIAIFSSLIILLYLIVLLENKVDFYLTKRRVSFYKKELGKVMNNSKKKSEPILQVEKAIEALEKDRSQTHIYNLVNALKTCLEKGSPLYVPLNTSEPHDLLEIPKLDLNHILQQRLPEFRKVEMEKGGMAFCAFTSQEEMDKGQPTDYQILSASDILFKALEDENVLGLILNPWSLSILLNKELLTIICQEEMDDEPTSFQSSLYIDQGECSAQVTDIVVNVAKNPFDFHEPSPEAFLKACGPELYDICFELPSVEPGKLIISEAPNLLAQRIFHAALPEKLDETSYTRFIYNILSIADKMEARSISIPAIGNEEGCVDPELPFAVIAAAGWFNAHPQSKISLTITCRQRETYENFLSYLFAEDME